MSIHTTDTGDVTVNRPVPKPDKPIRMVVCAANRYGPMMVLGPRHFDPTMHAHIALHKALMKHPEMSRNRWSISEQGFIDQWGIFMTREEAWVVALAAGQVRYGPHLSGGRLDSSDLY